MGFVSMRKNFGRHMRTVLYIIFAIFLVSCFYYFGSYVGGPQRREEGVRSNVVIATVNGEKIDRTSFEARFNEQYQRYEQMGMASLGMLEMEILRWQLLESLIQQKLMLEAAKQQGIRVSRRDVNKEIQRQINEILKARGIQKNSEDRRYVESRMRERADEVRDVLMLQRLQQMVESQVKATDEDVRNSYKEVKARHVLVRVDESGKAGLPDGKARQKAEGILGKLRAGADFATLAQRDSDDKASAVKGGDLGYFGPNAMTPEFSKAAFALKPGEISGLVKTPYGYHIIKVEDVRFNLPKDFDQKKADYRKQYIQQQGGRIWQQFTEELRRQAKIDIRDAEMRAVKAQMAGQAGDAIKEYTAALKYARQLGDQVHAAIYYNLGELYAQKNDWKKVLEVDEAGADIAMSSLQDFYLALGRAYGKVGNTAKSLEYYKLAEEEAPDDYSTRQQLLTAYQSMGDTAAAARQKAWIDEQERKWQEEQKKRMAEMARQSAAEAQQKAGATKSPSTAKPAETAEPPEAGKPSRTREPTTAPEPAGTTQPAPR